MATKPHVQSPSKLETLIDLFNHTLAKRELLEKQCLQIVRTELSESITFGQLQMRAYEFAQWLTQAGDIRPRDNVAILGKNRIDWDIVFWGVVLAGAVPVLIDPERVVEAVKSHLIHTDARAIVVADDYQDAASRDALTEFAKSRGLGLIEMTRIASRDSVGDTDEALADIHTKVQPDDTAVILCTSGTTGDPREVELTHANLMANIRGSVQKVKLTDRDKLGHILPPHHSFGLTVGKLLPFWAGATNVYTNKYRYIPDFIRENEITIFVAVPALFTVLAKNIEEAVATQKREKLVVRVLDRYLPKLLGKRIIRKLGWSELRFFLSGSAPVPRWVLDVLWKRGILLYEGYGTTENSPVYGFNDSPQKLGSVGKPISTLLVRIVDENKRALPAGEKGEIALGGPCIMKGYYKNAPATEAAVWTDRDGTRWLRTGDLGYLDTDGNLFITGRKKFLIVLPGGKKVHPERVESELSQARFVKEILVVPGSRKSSAGVIQEAIKALVQPAWDQIEMHTRLAQSELAKQPQMLKSLIWRSIDECQRKSRQLSHFEKVSSQHVEIAIEEFQKTSTGKIRREAYMKL
jgi:long-chain acyl-CoA synthetase